MKIQINADHSIIAHEKMINLTEAVIEGTLGHLANHISRVEVYIKDENGEKGGARDKRCTMEARLKGHQPIAVSHTAETLYQAIDGAADKLKSLLYHTLGRITNHEGRRREHSRSVQTLAVSGMLT